MHIHIMTKTKSIKNIKNIKNINNVKNINNINNIENVKKIRMTVPSNGFEQIKANPFFFTKESLFFTYLQEVRNQTREIIHIQQFNNCMQSQYNSNHSYSHDTDDDEKMFAPRIRRFYEEENEIDIEYK